MINMNMRNKLIKFCRLTQEQLKQHMIWELKALLGNVTVGDGYVLAKGDFPVLLVAHLDTVHSQLPEDIVYDELEDVLSSAQGIGGDDRCGVLMILELIHKHRCSVLLCEDEEQHGVGAMKFVTSKDIDGLFFNYIVEFDRKGSNDAVFYKCANQAFIDFVTADYYQQDYGTFSDICVVAPRIGCAAVNLSCGYYNAHTLSEYVVIKEMQDCIDAADRLLGRTKETDKFGFDD